MSVYSGFASRALESSYSRALYNVLCLLQIKVTKDLRGEQFDDISFERHFNRFYGKLCYLDESKHLPPRFSYALKDLASHFGVLDKPPKPSSPSMSSCTSNASIHKLIPRSSQLGRNVRGSRMTALSFYGNSNKSLMKNSTADPENEYKDKRRVGESWNSWRGKVTYFKRDSRTARKSLATIPAKRTNQSFYGVNESLSSNPRSLSPRSAGSRRRQNSLASIYSSASKRQIQLKMQLKPWMKKEQGKNYITLTERGDSNRAQKFTGADLAFKFEMKILPKQTPNPALESINSIGEKGSKNERATELSATKQAARQKAFSSLKSLEQPHKKGVSFALPPQ